MNSQCDVCRKGSKTLSIISNRIVCIFCFQKMINHGERLLIKGPDNPDQIHVYLKDDRTLGYQIGPTPNKVPLARVLAPDIKPPVVEDTPFDVPRKALDLPAPSKNNNLPDLSKMDKRSKAYKDAIKRQQLQPA